VAGQQALTGVQAHVVAQLLALGELLAAELALLLAGQTEKFQ
jgi:hypothetical protein